MGPPVNRSQFPAPSGASPECGSPPKNACGVAALGVEDPASTVGCVAFFEHLHADVAGLWLLGGLCGDEVISWLRSLFNDVSGHGGLWKFRNKLTLGDEAETAKELETSLLKRVVIGYMPRREQDLVHLAVLKGQQA